MSTKQIAIRGRANGWQRFITDSGKSYSKPINYSPCGSIGNTTYTALGPDGGRDVAGVVFYNPSEFGGVL
jgi:hypothetical protein